MSRAGSHHHDRHSDGYEIDVPRDRAGTFEPQIVKKRQRRLIDVDEVCRRCTHTGSRPTRSAQISLIIYGAAVSKDTVSRITYRVLEEMATWHARPL
ncbi:transposase [Gordonia terrae]